MDIGCPCSVLTRGLWNLMFCFSEAGRGEGRYVVSGCVVALDGEKRHPCSCWPVIRECPEKSGNHGSPWRSEDREFNKREL